MNKELEDAILRVEALAYEIGVHSAADKRTILLVVKAAQKWSIHDDLERASYQRALARNPQFDGL